MEPFSKQIQDEISNSGLSHYRLAKLAGISESAISRFMAGNNSMSLKTLNGIAYALGLKIEAGVALINRPRNVGRPKAEEPKKMRTIKKLTKCELRELAILAATEAAEQNFSSRRGVYFLEEVGAVYYDNNPFALPREVDKRESLIQLIREFLNESNLHELSSAYWPETGDDKDYTFAMIIEAKPNQVDYIREGIQEVLNAFLKRSINGG